MSAGKWSSIAQRISIPWTLRLSEKYTNNKNRDERGRRACGRGSGVVIW
jgi:hypothetical protein